MAPLSSAPQAPAAKEAHTTTAPCPACEEVPTTAASCPACEETSTATASCPACEQAPATMALCPACKEAPTAASYPVCHGGVKPDAVAITKLSFSHNREPVLLDINLTVHQGDFMALIGPNGGGKTTLLRLMLGLLKPQTGSVRIFGESPEQMQDHMGYVPQFSTMKSDFPATILDAVLMGGAKRSFFGGRWPRGKESKRQALEHLETLGLADMANAPVHALSGGQRQRVLVARALMGRPEGSDSPFMLLLDEPTASIDPQGKFCFYEFLGNLRGKVTIVVVSHDLFVASPFFSHVAFINKTATLLPDGAGLSGQELSALFGIHAHACPVADLQHAGGLVHMDDCTYNNCRHDG